MFTEHIAKLSIYRRKSVNGKIWIIIWREWTRIPKFGEKDTIDNLLNTNFIEFRYSFLQQQIFQLQTKKLVLPIQWVQICDLEEELSLAPVSVVLHLVQGNDNFQ